MGLVNVHDDVEQAQQHIAEHARSGEAITVATNDEAPELDERIRSGRVEVGAVDDAITVTGSDEWPNRWGDLIQTGKDDTALGVANRQ